MAFIHKIRGVEDHRHDTTAQARDCFEWHQQHATKERRDLLNRIIFQEPLFFTPDEPT